MTISSALIVDDSKVARFALRKLLEKLDLSVEMAGSGEEAIEFVEGGNIPDVIFMDQLMPGMNGVDAAIRIKAMPAASHVPVIMCTSKKSDEFSDEVMKSGIYDVLTKPAEPSRVSELISQLERELESAPAAIEVDEESLVNEEELELTLADADLGLDDDDLELSPELEAIEPESNINEAIELEAEDLFTDTETEAASEESIVLEAPELEEIALDDEIEIASQPQVDTPEESAPAEVVTSQPAPVEPSPSPVASATPAPAAETTPVPTAATEVPHDVIADIARSAVRTSVNNRLHELLSGLFDDQFDHFNRIVTDVSKEQKALLEKVMQEHEQSIKEKTDAIKAEIATEVSMFISNQLKEVKTDLIKQIDTQAALTPDFDELKEQIQSAQQIDTEFWQKMQADAIQQAHEMSRQTAEDVAEQAIETFLRRQKKDSAKFYGFAMAVSIGVFAAGIAVISGLF